MDKKALHKAASRLRVASKALEDIKACEDHEAFTDFWYTFLTASKNIYTVLEQGAKVSPQSRQWFGLKAAERRGDDLLQYLYEARNDDEHGLEPISTHVEGGTLVGIRKDGFSESMTMDAYFDGEGRGHFNVRSHDGKPVLIKQSQPHAALVAIRARGGRTLTPPTTHLGKPLSDSSPFVVASTALDYLEGLVAEAEARAV